LAPYDTKKIKIKYLFRSVKEVSHTKKIKIKYLFRSVKEVIRINMGDENNKGNGI
jgi:hypothetical protein